MTSLSVTFVAAILLTVLVLFMAVNARQWTPEIQWPERILLAILTVLMAVFWVGVGMLRQSQREPVSYTAELPVVRAALALPCPGRPVIRDLERLRRGHQLDEPEFVDLERAVRAEGSPASRMRCDPREAQARREIAELLRKSAP